jgi:hypothetical protein
MRIKQILKGIDIGLGLLLRAWRDGMTRHRDGQRYSLGILKASLVQASTVMCAFTYNSGRNLRQPLGGGLSFRPAPVKAVVKFEQRLSHRVREGNSA